MILVVGATGSLGGEIAERLLKQGRSVRVLVRRNSPAAELAPRGLATAPERLTAAGAQQAYGDLKDRASLDLACSGVETVITTANSAKRGGGDTAETVDLQGNRSLIDAARGAGVRQVVFVSAHGASPRNPVPFFQAKARTEEYLQESGLTWTIVAPDAFMEVWLAVVVAAPALSGQPVTVIGGGATKHSFISSSDVAAFCAAAVDHSAAANRKLVIGGPQALSFRDAAAVFSRVLGREIPVVSVQPGEMIPGAPPAMSQLLPGLELQDSIVDTTELARTFGVRLTGVEEFARRIAQASGIGR